jgi:hypothetical protein
MISICDLPTEILLQIIEESLLEIEHLPLLGSSAAYTAPNAFLGRHGPLPNPDYDKEFLGLREDKKELVKVYASSVKALRL